MLQVCWSPKGGTGTSVVAAAIAVQAAAAGRDTLLVDLAGDQTAIFGVAEGEGIGDWFAAPADVGPESLRALGVDIVAGLRLLRLGTVPSCRWEAERMALAMALFETSADFVVVDCGREPVGSLPAGATTTVVTRACYLSVRRVRGELPPGSRIVLVEEPGRALSRRDIAAALGEIDVVIPWDPAIARAVDAGMLATRVPRSLRPLRGLVEPTGRARA